MNHILDGLIDILKNNAVNIDPSLITMDADILEDLDIESITILGIIPEVEEKFGINLDPLVLLEKSTVKDFVNEIDRLQSNFGKD